MSAGSLEISDYVADNKIDSIIWIGYPSQSGGDALVDVILGNFNPSGRLPVTWYPGNYFNVSMADVSMRPD